MLHSLLKKYWNTLNFKWYLASAEAIKIVIGAGTTSFSGWYSTDKEILNLTKESDFEKFIPGRNISHIMAEHVFEHLTEQEILTALHLIHKYSTFNVTIRVAVPDGFNPDPEYIEKVRPGGTGKGAHEHKHLFNYLSLIELFYRAGFTGNPIEYFDENNVFHQGYTNDEKGYISRSYINDSRNNGSTIIYSSLIIDFTKVE